MNKKAFGIISLLDLELDIQAQQLWSKSGDLFSHIGVEVSKFPHFSWQVASNYRIDDVVLELEQIAKTIKPFSIQVSGFGVFPGIKPVAYFTLVRTSELNSIHQKIWKACSALATDLNPYYWENRWIPHITIAYKNLSPLDFSYLIENMVADTWEYELRIQNLAIAYQMGDESGVINTLSLGDGD